MDSSSIEDEKESFSAMEERHAREKSELETTISAMLAAVKSAKKSKKSETEFLVTQLRFDLSKKHNDEEDEHESNTDGQLANESTDSPATTTAEVRSANDFSVEISNDTSAESKKAKAKRKQVAS